MLLVHERLCAAYGCPIPYFHDLDPLSELVSSLLSHRTRNADFRPGLPATARRFPDWAHSARCADCGSRSRDLRLHLAGAEGARESSKSCG